MPINKIRVCLVCNVVLLWATDAVESRAGNSGLTLVVVVIPPSLGGVAVWAGALCTLETPCVIGELTIASHALPIGDCEFGCAT